MFVKCHLTSHVIYCLLHELATSFFFFPELEFGRVLLPFSMTTITLRKRLCAP